MAVDVIGELKQISTMFNTCLGIIFALSVSWLVSIWFRSQARGPLPPGPPGLPILGNVLDFPTVKPWVVFGSVWGKKYGPIVSARLLNQVFIIINDADVASEIMNKRGSTYAGRPTSIMIELANYHHIIAAEPYGERFREYRKLLNRILGPRAGMKKFQDIGEFHAHKLLQDLRALKPNNEGVHLVLRKAVGAVALHITYGYEVQDNPDSQDPFVTLAERGQNQFADMAAPGKWIVEYIPILRHIPAWVPFAHFKRVALSYAETSRLLHDLPFQYTQALHERGSAPSSFVGDLLSDDDNMTQDKLEYIKWVAGSIYGASADTTTTTLSAYCIAMCLYPEVQERLHAEIDEVTEGNRLPTYSDRPNLPYTEAVCKEVQRWLPIAPMAMPHRTTRDDVYGPYFIPKNSLVITNCWAMQHDEKVHPNPTIFRPERFLGPTPERDPVKEVFGFGKRACPGLHLADLVIFIMVAKMAAAFNVKKAIGPDGQPISPSTNTSKNGLITAPDPYPCTFTARMPELAAILSESFRASPYSTSSKK